MHVEVPCARGKGPVGYSLNLRMFERLKPGPEEFRNVRMWAYVSYERGRWRFQARDLRITSCIYLPAAAINYATAEYFIPFLTRQLTMQKQETLFARHHD